MKSPWNIIGRLIAGRKPIEETAPPVSSDGAPSSGQPRAIDRESASPKPDEQLATRDAEQRPGSIAKRPDDASASPLVRAGEPAITAPDFPDSNASADPADEAMNGTRPADSTHQLQTRRQRRTALSAAPDVKTGVNEVLISRSSGEQRALGFAADVIAVEAEVRILRRQLAQKLTVQNAQLRQMLERFKST